MGSKSSMARWTCARETVLRAMWAKLVLDLGEPPLDLADALVEFGEPFRGQAVLTGAVATERGHHASRFLTALPVLALESLLLGLEREHALDTLLFHGENLMFIREDPSRPASWLLC